MHGDRVIYSATDLVAYLACEHLTELDRLASAGDIGRPPRDDRELEAIAARGDMHEAAFLEELQDRGRDVRRLDAEWPEEYAERPAFYARQAVRTREAIAAGAEVIFQACFYDGTWLGFADFLLRVQDPRARSGFSYEVADTKLARRAKASALLQMCVYSELLTAIQGAPPEYMHVVLGGKSREQATFRTADFMAYYRAVKARFEEDVGRPRAASYEAIGPYPEPVEHCGVCRWK